MKSIVLLLCLFLLAACGNKKENEPEMEGRTCLIDCVAKGQVEIVSAPLPLNVMVKFEISGHVFDVIDECETDEYQMGEITRGELSDRIQFDIYGKAPDLESKITIFDRGMDCDEEDVFFEDTVTPTELQTIGINSKIIYTLNN